LLWRSEEREVMTLMPLVDSSLDRLKIRQQDL